MKLFIFKTHPKWNYCGGLFCIVAQTFEHAGELGRGYRESEYDDASEHAQFLETPGDKDYDAVGYWVLCATLDVSSETEERVIAARWNYA